MTGPTVGLRQQHTVNEEIVNRAMRVSHQNYINTRHLTSDCNRGVFVWDLGGIWNSGTQIFFDAHVHRDYDNVNFFAASQKLYPLLRFADGFAKLQTLIVRFVLPVWNTWRRQAKDSNLHSLH